MQSEHQEKHEAHHKEEAQLFKNCFGLFLKTLIGPLGSVGLAPYDSKAIVLINEMSDFNQVVNFNSAQHLFGIHSETLQTCHLSAKLAIFISKRVIH